MMEVSKVKAANEFPAFDTHVPFVGKIDLNSPMEWFWWGGLAFDLIFVSGFPKWVIAAGIIAARHECMERWSS
jgi:hypothetical protein